jgi:hypothetical protein
MCTRILNIQFINSLYKFNLNIKNKITINIKIMSTIKCKIKNIKDKQ